MATNVILEDNCKFAILAVQNLRVDVSSFVNLQDGTKVSEHLPVVMEEHWRDWLGTIQFKNLQACNLFFIRTATEGWANGALDVAGDAVSERLQREVGALFAMLRFLGTVEYQDAFVLSGHVENGQAMCRHFAHTERFHITRGCLPWLIRENDLRTAVDLYRNYSALQELPNNRPGWRFGRGCHALKTALEQYYASDRLHSFVRALEALILPEPGKTEKQFVSRCALWAGPKSAEAEIRKTLQEAYRMRCDVEHMHEWNRSLRGYAVNDWEDIALWRTRQMEMLACAAFRTVLVNHRLQQHFSSDADLQAFYNLSEADIRTLIGGVCDITSVRLVKNYDSFGRAASSEWPSGWIDNLRRKAMPA